MGEIEFNSQCFMHFFKMTEVEAFSIMVRLMEESPEKYMTLPKTSHSGGVKLSPKYSLRTLFTPQMKGLHLMLFQHTQLVKNLLPALYDHFQKNNINATMVTRRE